MTTVPVCFGKFDEEIDISNPELKDECVPCKYLHRCKRLSVLNKIYDMRRKSFNPDYEVKYIKTRGGEGRKK